MSTVTPSTDLTTWRERRNNPLASGKCTLRSLIEISGCESFSITLAWRTLQKLHSRNDTVSNALPSVGRREETRAGKYLPLAHIWARTDSPAAGAPDPAATRESDKASPVRPWDPAPIAKGPACTDCLAVRTVQ